MIAQVQDQPVSDENSEGDPHRDHRPTPWVQGATMIGEDKTHRREITMSDRGTAVEATWGDEET